MDPITQQTTLASAGGKKDPVYVDDVFSTYLYTGNASTRSINNGIDLSGEGGLVWSKSRSVGSYHSLWDTERSLTGTNNWIRSDSTYLATDSQQITGFNNNGYTLGQDSNYQVINHTNYTYASWTFRKAPGFFDVVTYTGTGSTQNISHSLGSVPGIIIIKETSQGNESWAVYHRSLGATKVISLNNVDAAWTSSGDWNNTAPTSSVFTVGTESRVNTSGESYVAYIFAHDDASFGTDGDESIIKCGTYVGTGSTQTIDCGFEPGWVMLKNIDRNNTSWNMYDEMRTLGGKLLANETDQEDATNGTQFFGGFASNGFILNGGSSQTNDSGKNFIYMAIRRPNKPPEVGTDVFAIDTRGGTSPNPPTFNSEFPVDLVTRRDITTSDWTTRTRLLGENKILQFNTTAAESTQTSSTVTFDQNDGVGSNTGVDGSNYAWMFKRAPGFMDVVAYSGSTTTTQNVAHSLGVVPEMMIIKNRDAATNWVVYHTVVGATKFIRLNTDQDPSSSGGLAWNDTAPTASVFTLGNNGWDGTNYNGHKFIAYLFATLPGISKVGTYTGSSSAINVDCGFTNGARFVMVKKTSGSGDWVVWDTLRGIGSGNEPFLKLNESQGQTTGSDLIAPLSSGFTINNSGVGNVNASGQTYLFLAIA